jgi:hypothetical protein
MVSRWSGLSVAIFLWINLTSQTHLWADVGNGWIRTKEGRWVVLASAQFTADSNPVMNINAALKDNRFLLATGGATENSGVKLNETITIPGEKSGSPPKGLPAPEGRSTK